MSLHRSKAKWNTKSEYDWLKQVRRQAGEIALKAETGELVGLEVQEAIVSLFRRAIEHMPDEAVVNAIERKVQ